MRQGVVSSAAASGGYRGYHGEYPLRCHLILSEHFAVWVSAWVKALTHFLTQIIFQQKQRKSPEILRFQGFFGCGGRI